MKHFSLIMFVVISTIGMEQEERLPGVAELIAHMPLAAQQPLAVQMSKSLIHIQPLKMAEPDIQEIQRSDVERWRFECTQPLPTTIKKKPRQRRTRLANRPNQFNFSQFPDCPEAKTPIDLVSFTYQKSD
ncbi:hypothetical protein BH09DEP1_BH09DEP1_7510 [soil metagenome]